MKMRAVLGLLAVGLCARTAFGKFQVSFRGARHVDQEDGHHAGFANVLQEASSADNMPQAGVVLRGNRDLQAEVDAVCLISGASVFTTLTIQIVINVFVETIITSTFETTFNVTTNSIGNAKADITAQDIFFNADQSDICDDCTLEAEQIDCPDTGCDEGFTASVVGDPHMVGLLGQKIDWAGVDNAWYCLLSDGPNFHVNVRLSAPMQEEFPDRQLISAVSVLTNDGLHSLVVEVKNPYTTDTDGCPKDSSVPCLADGGLRILVDGVESAAMETPTENARLPGGSPFVVSAANLPAECRPFGGDRVWANKFADMVTDQRSLRSSPVSFDQWILQPDTLAAPTWCAKFLEEGGSVGLLSTRSEHATLRVETPVAVVRINVGVNYQDLETAPDGTVLVPELEFWQTDVEFGGLQVSGHVAGLMGDTSRFVLDDEGVPVTSGLGALHGPVESYRVAGPFARDFEKMRG